MSLYFQYIDFFSPTQEGEITVYGMNLECVASLKFRTPCRKYRHDYRLKQSLGRQDPKTT